MLLLYLGVGGVLRISEFLPAGETDYPYIGRVKEMEQLETREDLPDLLQF